MADEVPDLFAQIAGDLYDRQNVYFAPIRHHSPACAWALREMIRAVRPAAVLIEAPIDFQHHIDLLLDDETRMPVAIASLIGSSEQRVAAYYPFCDHSPELIALQEGKACGAKLRFIDLPSASKALNRRSASDEPIVLSSDDHFDASDYTSALAAKLGCRDSFELWDHLFETRIGEPGWEAFFRDVAAYCAGIRASTPQAKIEQYGDAEREAFMNAQIADHLGKQPIIVVTGGFHTPALLDAIGQPVKPSKLNTESDANSYLIRYGFEALDALNGYSAGLPHPAFYQTLWQDAEDNSGPPQWTQIGVDYVTRFASTMRAEGVPIPLPAEVEMLRIAETLARIRGRPGLLRYDLFDGARAALVKGEAGAHDVWSQRLGQFLTGSAIGDIPASAGSPPLVEDVRDRARANKVDVTDGARRRRNLDIHRKPTQLKASRFLHAMSMLETGFAERVAGPDFVAGARTDLLFEEWSYAWSPAVEGRLIELSVLGGQLPIVCLNKLRQIREALEDQGRSGDISVLVEWLSRGLLAGLGNQLTPFLLDLSNDIKSNANFDALATSLKRLHAIANTRGPLRPPSELDFEPALDATFLRLVYLIDDLSETPRDLLTTRLNTLKLLTEFLRGSAETRFDLSLFHEAIDRLVDRAPPAEILGATLAICVQARRRTPDELAGALSGHFGGASISHTDRIGVLVGLLATVPTLLWSAPQVLECVDEFICSLDEDAFIEILPALRHAFTALNPRETERLAGLLANSRGYSPSRLTASPAGLTESDLARGLAIERALRASIASDHLETWLLEGGDG